MILTSAILGFVLGLGCSAVAMVILSVVGSVRQLGEDA